MQRLVSAVCAVVVLAACGTTDAPHGYNSDWPATGDRVIATFPFTP